MGSEFSFSLVATFMVHWFYYFILPLVINFVFQRSARFVVAYFSLDRFFNRGYSCSRLKYTRSKGDQLLQNDDQKAKPLTRDYSLSIAQEIMFHETSTSTREQ